MTTVACVSPRTTVLITCVLPLAYLLSYVIMEKKHYSHKSDEACDDEHLTCNEKLALMCQNLRGVAAFCVGAFVEYLILGSIVTTLAFQNSPFNPRDHYVYYVLMITMGEFIGRSYISMFSICTRKHSLAVRQTWIFSGAMLILGTLLGFAAWYRFLPNIGLVLVLVLAIGILNGMLYINTILSAAQDEDSRSKVFSRGFSMLGVAVGSIIAALLGLLLEPVLRGHCMEVSSSDQFCFTRPMSAWNSSDSCMTH